MADDDLMGVPEIAQLLQLSLSEADELIKERGFPEPAEQEQREKRMHYFWSRGEVENWARESGRLK